MLSCGVRPRTDSHSSAPPDFDDLMQSHAGLPTINENPSKERQSAPPLPSSPPTGRRLTSIASESSETASTMAARESSVAMLMTPGGAQKFHVDGDARADDIERR